MADAPLRILFVTRKWAPAVGGMETYCDRLTEALGKRNRVDVIALAGRKDGRGPSLAALALFGLTALLRILGRRTPDIVHVADLASWPLAWFAGIVHPFSRVVISAHGSDVSVAFRPGTAGRLYRAYLALGARLLREATVIANSAYIADLVRQAGFVQVTAVPLATELRGEEQGARRDLLFAGRISRAKGLRFLVEEVLPRLDPAVRLKVAGPVWEESERPLLSNPRVDYLGALSPAEMAKAYASAAAVLIPTRQSEGFGLVAIEAAACGAPVVASNHSGLGEVVSGPIGSAVDADDPAAWACEIETILARPAGEQAAASTAAMAEVDARYRWPRVAADTEAAYRAS